MVLENLPHSTPPPKEIATPSVGGEGVYEYLLEPHNVYTEFHIRLT